jgi:hypothetical protein
MSVSEGIAEEGHYIADRRERYGPDLQSVQDKPSAVHIARKYRLRNGGTGQGKK